MSEFFESMFSKMVYIIDLSKVTVPTISTPTLNKKGENSNCKVQIWDNLITKSNLLQKVLLLERI